MNCERRQKHRRVTIPSPQEYPLLADKPAMPPRAQTASAREHVNMVARFENFEHRAAQGLSGLQRKQVFWKEWTATEVQRYENSPEDVHLEVPTEVVRDRAFGITGHSDKYPPQHWKSHDLLTHT